MGEGKETKGEPVDAMRVEMECERIDELVKAGVTPRNVWFQSVVIEILIHLRDLCAAAERLGEPLRWSDDITPCKFYSNITDLIIFCRDGFCHSHTYHRCVAGTGPEDEISMVWNVVTGRGSGLAMMRGKLVTLESSYPDDTAVYLGAHRIYLKRHMIRTFDELLAVFEKRRVLSESFMQLHRRPNRPQS